MPLIAVAERSQAPAAGEFRPPPAPDQPIAYSHKTHLALDLQCVTCHAGAERDDHATLPATSTCMRCHSSIKTDSPEIQKLAGYDTRKEDIPWKRVYRVPTYVTFSHHVHSSEKSTTCATCHGNVRDLAVMQKVKDISMAACVQCHTERAAPIRCDTCHEPR
jgi:hypothetical protein